MSTRIQNVKKQSRATKTVEKPKRGDEKTKAHDAKAEEAQLLTKKTLPSKLKLSSNKPSSTSRISKSQFYPNKDEMYKNALKGDKTKTTKERERNKTRTLSPSEVKVLKNEEKPTTSNVKRPGTATIKKNVEEETYESDFDSYESDFEEYISESSVSSEEEEAKSNKDLELDSGTYDIAENNKHKQILSNITELIENESNNSIPKSNNCNNVSNFTSLSDEGFEEIKNEKVHFVNFVEARRRSSQIKLAEIKKKRGQDLLSMIQLDNQNFTIFELQPIAYDVFMKFYGNRNSMQSSVQTGDDDVDEETSTDQIELRTAWTQHPTKLDPKNFEDLKLYRSDYLGVGHREENESYTLKHNENDLAIFLKSASEAISTLLEEKSQQHTCNDIENNEKKLPFSDGHITFNTNLDFLVGMKINSASFSENTTKVLTVHNSIEGRKSLMCLWKISDQNSPENVFSIYGSVNCCNLNNFSVFAGLHDGTISIWKSNCAQNAYDSNHIPPTFISDVQKGHSSKIISITPIESSDPADQNNNNGQIYTLDEDGLLIIWSMIELQKYNAIEIHLHINSKVNFKELYSNFDDLQCTDLCVNKLDPTQVFVSTNYGNVLRFVTTGKKSHPKYYVNTSDGLTASNCVVNSPFSPLYFLCGYQNGNVVLFSREVEKPLMVMSNANDESGIDFVEWSINKPCVFYTKDSNDTVHIWDLTKSDIFPIYSMRFKEKIDFMKLSPGISENNTVKRSYMIVITDNNTVSLYILNKEHGQQDKKDYEDNIRKFTNYVNRL